MTVAERARPALLFPWPSDRPAMFWCQLGAEEISPSGTSYLNRTEAAAVEKIVTHLLKSGALRACGAGGGAAVSWLCRWGGMRGDAVCASAACCSSF